MVEHEVSSKSSENAPKISFEEYVTANPILGRAYEVAETAHKKQKRKDGSPYITHLIAVAKILYIEWGIENTNMLAAALLHDTVEDTKISLDKIRSNFGDDIAGLVEGVTQFRSQKESLTKEESDRETIRKITNKNYIDPRVGVLKLADRLHNMRTLEFVEPKKQVKKAKETLFYAKLAESLGMWEVMRELEDLSFKYINPTEYTNYLRLRDEDPRTQEIFVEGIKSSLKQIIRNTGVMADVNARKNSIMRIIEKRGKYLPDKIDNLISFRIKVKGKGEIETRNGVMNILGAVWQEYSGIEEQSRFDNFFFVEKDNGYSAFHVTLKFPEGSVKIVITSEEKEEYNNDGILSLIRSGETDLQKYSLILVTTPTKEIKFFKQNAKGGDYAYSISPRMGARADHILIDGEPHELSEILPNGADVEIRFGEPRRTPKPGLINFVLPATRRVIERQLDDEIKWKETMKGKDLVTNVILNRGLIDLEDLNEIEKFKHTYEDILYILGGKEDVNALYYKIGSGVMDIKRLEDELDSKHITKSAMGLTTVYIEGENIPGMSKSIIGNIADLGGDIDYQKGNTFDKGCSFSIKLIVNKFTKEVEEILEQELRKNSRLRKIVIV